MKHFALAALGLAMLAPVAAAAQPMYPPGGPGPGTFHRRHHVIAFIAQVNGGSFVLRDGQTIFLHQGTVINPTGRPLRAGQRVDIHGDPAGNGAMNANVINILPRY